MIIILWIYFPKAREQCLFKKIYDIHIYIYIYEGIPHIYLLLFLFLKVLAQNSGYDPQETLVKVQTEHLESEQPVGIDLNTGKKVKKN